MSHKNSDAQSLCDKSISFIQDLSLSEASMITGGKDLDFREVIPRKARLNISLDNPPARRVVNYAMREDYNPRDIIHS